MVLILSMLMMSLTLLIFVDDADIDDVIDVVGAVNGSVNCYLKHCQVKVLNSTLHIW